MKKAIIYGAGATYLEYIDTVIENAIANDIEIVGVASNDIEQKDMGNIKPIKKSQIKNIYIDICILAIERGYQEVREELIEFGVDDEKIVPIALLARPGFSLDSYIKVKNSNISIVSRHCWGGVTYHTLKIPFYTPFINMFLKEDDYISLVSDLEYYINSDISFHHTQKDITSGIEYPVAKCRDIFLHFNHANNFENAKNDWNRRKERINFDNLFFESFSTDIKHSENFDKKIKKNSICFTPRKQIDYSSSIYLPEEENIPYWKSVMDTARNKNKNSNNILNLINNNC